MNIPALPSDLGTALHSLMIQSRGAQSEASQAEVEHAAKLLERAREEIDAAMARAAEAQDSAGFWGELASVFGGEVAAILGAIAAAALVVATGGSGAPAVIALAAAALSTTLTVGRELGMSPTACAVLGAAGTLVSVAAGNVSGAAGAFGAISTTASTLEAGATAVSGGATIAAGQYQGDALDAQADGKVAETHQDDAWFRMEVALDLLEQAAQDLERGRTRVAAIQQTEHEMNNAVIARIGTAS